MLKDYDADLIDRGVYAAESSLPQQLAAWAGHTDEKSDVAESLAKVIRSLSKAAPLSHPFRALSVGSSQEPLFQTLEGAFRGGLYLLDIDETALASVDRRVERQRLKGVHTVLGDYTRAFASTADARHTLDAKLGGRPFELITLHHALYYSDKATWRALIESLYQGVLGPLGAIHVALMSARPREGTTTWLYNHFAEKFFGQRNDQDLLTFKGELEANPNLACAQLVARTSEVEFFIDDFELFMAVIWMIMLYPHVHDYTLEQKREITSFLLENFWRPGKPLKQDQYYLAIYKGVPPSALV
ncbi:MAG: class I SAM-dependent methyltransferase [Pseudomonadota bacterium]